MASLLDLVYFVEQLSTSLVQYNNGSCLLVRFGGGLVLCLFFKGFFVVLSEGCCFIGFLGVLGVFWRDELETDFKILDFFLPQT